MVKTRNDVVFKSDRGQFYITTLYWDKDANKYVAFTRESRFYDSKEEAQKVLNNGSYIPARHLY